MLGHHSWRARSRHRVGLRPDRTVAIAVLLVVACLSACVANRSVQTGATNSTDVVGVTTFPVQDRHPAPALAGPTLQGQSLSLTSYGRGDIVVINVWASWCGPCKAESPMLASAAKSLQSEGVRFIGVDEQDTASSARAFVASVGAAYPDLVDPEGQLLRKLTLLPQMGVPSTLVLDTQGRMSARVIGPMTLRQLQQILKTLRAEA